MPDLTSIILAATGLLFLAGSAFVVGAMVMTMTRFDESVVPFLVPIAFALIGLGLIIGALR